MTEEKQMTEMAINQDTQQEEKVDISSPRVIRKRRKAELISFAVTICALFAAAYIPDFWVKGISILIAICSLIAPAIVMKIIERNSFSLAYVQRTLAEAGLNPVIVDGELHCLCNGKDTAVKVLNGAMFQLTREYQISTKSNLDIYVRAAAATTREVCSVKVGIRRDGDDVGAMVFSAESFCPSAKVFRQVFAGYMQALDVAEQRQGDNLKEVLSRDDKPRRKIGFVTSNSN